MKLPTNDAYPNFDEMHLLDDWCAKSGCVPVSLDEMSEAFYMQLRKCEDCKEIVYGLQHTILLLRIEHKRD
jgi:hypothetical protein